MSSPSKMVVTIDDAIRSRPELLAQVEEAQREFEEQYFEPPIDASDFRPSAKWNLLRSGTSEEIRLDFSERDSLGQREFARAWPAKHMADRVARHLLVSRAWGFVLRLRSEQRMRYINQLLSQVTPEGDGRGNTN